MIGWTTRQRWQVYRYWYRLLYGSRWVRMLN